MVIYNLKEAIKIEEIDLKSDEYSFEYFISDNADESLIKYLKKYGMVYLPVLIKKNYQYKIVLGKKYIMAVREIQDYIQYCLVIEKLIDELDFLKFTICLKKEMKGFNVVEKAIVVKKLSNLYGFIDKDIIYMIGVPNNHKIIKNYIYLAESSDYIKSLILKGLLNEVTAFDIFKFPKENWDILARFIKNITLGTKKRNQILRILYILTNRDKDKILKLINGKEIKSIFKQEIDSTQKGEMVYKYFERLRYPSIYQFKEKFNEKLKKCGIKKNFDLIIPENFEEWKFKIAFDFSSMGDFKKNVEKLKTLENKEEFKNLIESRY